MSMMDRQRVVDADRVAARAYWQRVERVMEAIEARGSRDACCMGTSTRVVKRAVGKTAHVRSGLARIG